MKNGLKVLSSVCLAKPSPLSESPTASITHVVMESGTSTRSWASPETSLLKNMGKGGEKKSHWEPAPGQDT